MQGTNFPFSLKMKKIVFLLAVAVLAAAEDVSDLSEEVSAAVSSADSPLVTLLKTQVGCLNKQLKVCEALLTTQCKHRKLNNKYIFFASASNQHLTMHDNYTCSCLQGL